jgi:dipeptidyl aminopeptidase/acylaminoacyl peptidase
MGNRFPAWSPDGSSIAYVSGDDIAVLPAAGGSPVVITGGPDTDAHPTWSPDGSTIAFQSDRGGKADLWSIPAAGGTPVQLTSDLNLESDPAWSRDGAWIAFGANPLGFGEIYGLAVGGAGPAAAYRVTSTAGDAREPAWSPAGDQLAFSRNGTLWIATIPGGPGAPAAVARSRGAAAGAPSAPAAAASGLPAVHSLSTGTPNPFRASTTVRFALPAPGRADLVVFDVAGRRVRTLVSGELNAGVHAPVWDGRDDAGRRVAAGVYFVRLKADGFDATRKAVRLE